jgi:hypothetical protein
LRFADSSAVIWSNSAILTIENWSGSPTGGGYHQVFFGVNSAGLTAQQLSQLQFHNPNGIGGTRGAAILGTGEIVPAHLLGFQPSPGHLALQWASPMILQSATNVAGPYQDVSGTANPYVIDLALPSRFFRLRK